VREKIINWRKYTKNSCLKIDISRHEVGKVHKVQLHAAGESAYRRAA
jgi:hypothetical protein